MTEVAFHFNVADRIGYACRLLRKAAVSQASVWVVADGETVDRLDHLLWGLAPTDFLAHCRVGAPGAVLQRSPVVLSTAAAVPQGLPADVLLNLDTPVPDGFSRFNRLIEIVSADGTDRQPARARWKHYADRGYAIVRHDVAPTA